MSGVRSMLARVQRLEQARVAPKSPIEIWFGSLAAFNADTQAGIDAGELCSVDMPVIMKCLERWHHEGAWAAWHQGTIWGHGR